MTEAVKGWPRWALQAAAGGGILVAGWLSRDWVLAMNAHVASGEVVKAAVLAEIAGLKADQVQGAKERGEMIGVLKDHTKLLGQIRDILLAEGTIKPGDLQHSERGKGSTALPLYRERNRELWQRRALGLDVAGPVADLTEQALRWEWAVDMMPPGPLKGDRAGNRSGSSGTPAGPMEGVPPAPEGGR